MGDELTLLLEIFHKIEKAGGQATLSVSTAGGNTKVKLEITTTPTSPSVSSPSSSAPGRRHRRRGARARARRNQGAAAHQASLAETATSVSLDPPPHPLHLLPSPPPASGRRRVMSVGRPEMPTFSYLNLDGSSSPTPSAPPSSPPPQPLCYDECNIPEEHCKTCGMCEFLCIEHSGCHCNPTPDGFWNQDFEDYEFECAVCYCMSSIRHTTLKEDHVNI